MIFAAPLFVLLMSSSYHVGTYVQGHSSGTPSILPPDQQTAMAYLRRPACPADHPEQFAGDPRGRAPRAVLAGHEVERRILRERPCPLTPPGRSVRGMLEARQPRPPHHRRRIANRSLPVRPQHNRGSAQKPACHPPLPCKSPRRIRHRARRRVPRPCRPRGVAHRPRAALAPKALGSWWQGAPRRTHARSRSTRRDLGWHDGRAWVSH